MTDPSLPIEITDEEMTAFLERVEACGLLEKDFDLIKAMAESVRRIRHVLQEKDASIGRLVKMIFGAKTESAKNVLKRIEKDQERSSGKSELLDASSRTEKEGPWPKRKRSLSRCTEKVDRPSGVQPRRIVPRVSQRKALPC
jgi:hypothetical protein